MARNEYKESGKMQVRFNITKNLALKSEFS